MSAPECPDCGEEASNTELDMHGGVCKCCYDDFYFEDEDGDEDE